MKYPGFSFTDNIKFEDIQKFDDSKRRGISVMILDRVIQNPEISYKIENSIFEYSVMYVIRKKYNDYIFNGIYDKKLETIYNNIRTNEKLKNRILEGIIKPNTVAFLEPRDLSPESWQEYIIKEENRRKNASKQEYTTAYHCPKCKENKCTTRFYANRSADEALAICVSCINCGYQFII